MIDVSHGKAVGLDYVGQVYRILRSEIEAYNAEILKKPFLIIGNKVDLSEADTRLKIDGVSEEE